MSTRAQQYDAQVLRREQLSPHLVRLVLGGPGLAAFERTGIPDEWVGLVVPEPVPEPLLHRAVLVRR